MPKVNDSTMVEPLSAWGDRILKLMGLWLTHWQQVAMEQEHLPTHFFPPQSDCAAVPEAIRLLWGLAFTSLPSTATWATPTSTKEADWTS